MSYSLKKKICPSNLKNNPNKKMSNIEYITIHTTGNPVLDATASAHANYLYTGSGGGQTSWHYTVDALEIWQSFEDNSACWHAGDGNGKGNSASIGIEICDSDKTNFVKACDNAAQLTADLLAKYSLPLDRVVQHNKWSGKDCPKEIRAGNWGIDWSGFIELVKKYQKKKIQYTKNRETPIQSKPRANINQMKEWAKNKGAKPFFIELADKFYKISSSVGIDPIFAYCQSAKETGFGKFGGVLDESYCNPCGLKNSQGGSDFDPNAHMKFLNWEEGITAHIDHIALYAGVLGYPKKNSPDPRHFPYLYGAAKTVESMGSKWASSNSYGSDIVKMMNELINTNPKSEINENELDVLLNSFVEAGVMFSPEYWKNVITSNKVPYLKDLLINISKKL